VLNHHRQDYPDDHDQAQIEQTVSHGVLLSGLNEALVCPERRNAEQKPHDMRHAHTSFPFPVTMFQPQFTMTATRTTATQNAGCFA
jgi:hypothetical protein